MPQLMPDRSAVALSMIALGLLAGAAPADVLFDDDFDDGVLDPAWEITLECADDFTWEEAGTELTVSDFDTLCVDDGSGGKWTRAVFRRSISASADFAARVDFSWDSDNTNRAMQSLRLALWNGCGEVVADVWYSDAWILASGLRLVRIEDTQFTGSAGELPWAGAASVEVERVGCDVAIRWDDEELLTGETASAIESVTIEFGYYAYEGDGGPSVFGSGAVDRLTLEGEPATFTEADIDCSGFVDLGDLLEVLAAWGPCPEPPAPCGADVTRDGTVDLDDLLRILSDWGDGTVCG